MFFFHHQFAMWHQKTIGDEEITKISEVGRILEGFDTQFFLSFLALGGSVSHELPRKKLRGLRIKYVYSRDKCEVLRR